MPGKRRALLCGINDYQSVTDLRGCLADVEDMRSLLREVYGFAEDDIHVLTDGEVVKKRLKKEWQRLLKDAGPGDLLVFHFSGHGSYVPDREGEEEDGRDEILCLYDMDFDKPGTYLLDDEIDAWTRDKPEGADLVILTDCCHSGTSTRLMLREKEGRMVACALDEGATLRLAARSGAVPAEVEVLARFLPPPNYLPSRERALVRRGRREDRRPLNHLHLAACRDDETAADAPIGGRYHGAFTYHLVRALRAAPGLASNDLTAELARDLTAFPFAQHPQENGGPRPGPIFGARTMAGVPAEPPAGDLIAEIRHLIGAVRGLTASLGAKVGAREPGRRVLVYVHGIGEHPGDYSRDWWHALQPHLGGLYGDGALGATRHNVHWSDLVNARALPGGPAGEEQLLRRMIEGELEERAAREADPQRGADARRTLVQRGGAPQIDDFVRYMFSSAVRSQVLERFTTVVRPLLAEGAVVDIVSHSWGTVVAYEGLTALEGMALGGRVANLFTVGAALSIGAVRWKLGLGGRRPALVGRWFNLDAKGDGVGGALGHLFPLERDYIDLDPTGCTRGWFGYDLGCAHSSYFRGENVPVNRDIFARHLIEG